MNFEFDATITIPLIVSLATLVFAWFRTRRTAVDERFKAGSERMDRHDSRIQAVEQTIKTLPDRNDMHQIELSIERMNGTMTKIEAVMEGNQQIMTRLELIVTRHEEHLLQGNGR